MITFESRVVDCVEDLPLSEMYAAGSSALAAADRNSKPWVLWETESGDVYARSYYDEAETYGQVEPADDLDWPLTVIVPLVKEEANE